MSAQMLSIINYQLSIIFGAWWPINKYVVHSIWLVLKKSLILSIDFESIIYK